MTDWSTCPAVERNPRKINGAWAFSGTRVPVYALFEKPRERRDRETVSGMVSGVKGVAGGGCSQS